MKSPRESPSTDPVPSTDRFDTLFEALSHRYRRYVLYCLRETGAVPMGTLVDRVVDLESRRGTAATADRDDIRVALQHAHLPKLADDGIVTVDDGVVDIAASAEDVLPSQVELAREIELDDRSEA